MHIQTYVIDWGSGESCTTKLNTVLKNRAVNIVRNNLRLSREQAIKNQCIFQNSIY